MKTNLFQSVKEIPMMQELQNYHLIMIMTWTVIMMMTVYPLKYNHHITKRMTTIAQMRMRKEDFPLILILKFLIQATYF